MANQWKALQEPLNHERTEDSIGKKPEWSLTKTCENSRGFGVKKIRQTVTRPDTPVIRGMIEKIGYLIEIKK